MRHIHHSKKKKKKKKKKKVRLDETMLVLFVLA